MLQLAVYLADKPVHLVEHIDIQVVDFDRHSVDSADYVQSELEAWP